LLSKISQSQATIAWKLEARWKQSFKTADRLAAILAEIQ